MAIAVNTAEDTPERQQARSVRQRYTTTITALRSNQDLTDRPRTRRIAELSAELRKNLQNLKAAERTRLQAELSKGEKELFSGLRLHWDSSPQDAVSVRDAVDRAGRCRTPEEALKLLEQAQAVGDPALEGESGGSPTCG